LAELDKRMKMVAKTITLELPEDLVALLGPADAVAEKVRVTLVLNLLRDAQITQGQAARLLNATRYDILDLMARYAIPSGPQTAEEAQRDVEAARLGVSSAKTDAGG
jgi:hypothetical protein